MALPQTPAVLARHAERRDDDVQQHYDVDEVRDHVLPGRDPDEHPGGVQLIPDETETSRLGAKLLRPRPIIESKLK